jgi:hypothetical protein
MDLFFGRTERLLLWRSNLLMTVWTPAKLSGTYAQAVTAPTCGLELINSTTCDSYAEDAA